MNSDEVSLYIIGTFTIETQIVNCRDSTFGDPYQ